MIIVYGMSRQEAVVELQYLNNAGLTLGSTYSVVVVRKP